MIADTDKPGSSWLTPTIRVTLLLVIVLALLVYLPYRSCSLDDFDSFNFARALTNFEPSAGIPHAPGYVLYVALGQLMLRVTGDPRTALTLLSVLSASLACGVLFVLTTLLFDRYTGLTAFALVLLMPLMWLNADKALSDSPGVLFQSITMLGLVLAVQRRAPLWVASLLLGIAAGFRPQAVLGVALVLLVAVLCLRPRPLVWLQSALALLAGTMLWVVPLLVSFGPDITGFRSYMSGPTGFVAAEESLFSTTITAESIRARWSLLWHWGSQAFCGPLPEWARMALFGAAVVLIVWGAFRQRKQISLWLCFAWLTPQLALQLLFLNPSETRYMLALLFPAATLAAAGLQAVLRHRLALALAVVLAAVIGLVTLPLVRQLHSEVSPPDRLVAYLRSKYQASDTLVVGRQSYNALSYYLSGWDVRFLDYYGNEAMKEEFNCTRATYIVIADPEGLRPGEAFVEIESRVFEQNPQVHAKHSRVEVTCYGRVTDLAPRDFALPENGIIQMGTEQDARYVLDGWYRREDVGGVAARWTGAAPAATLRVYLPNKASRLSLNALSFAPAQLLDVFCNDVLVGQVSVPQTWTQLTVPLSDSCFSSESTILLRLCAATLKSPSAEGQSTDHRTLGIAVSRLQVLP